MKWPWTKRPEVATALIPEPAIGERWILNPTMDERADPFPRKDVVAVRIRDVQCGWVRYDFIGGGGVGGDDLRRPIGRFLGMYQKLPEDGGN